MIVGQHKVGSRALQALKASYSRLLHLPLVQVERLLLMVRPHAMSRVGNSRPSDLLSMIIETWIPRRWRQCRQRLLVCLHDEHGRDLFVRCIDLLGEQGVTAVLLLQSQRLLRGPAQIVSDLCALFVNIVHVALQAGLVAALFKRASER